MAANDTNIDKTCSCTREEVDLDAIRRIIGNNHKPRGALIAMLDDIQAQCGYLPQDALRMLSDESGLDMVDIYGVATFYHSFSLQPRGKHLICVCLGTACHVRGAPMVVEEFERRLGIRAGETTSDREFTLETANCLGACAPGPIVVVDGHYFTKVNTAKVEKILEETRAELDEPEAPLTPVLNDQEALVSPSTALA
jgi:NADH:ubiquinone oxidoreductase subunit E